MLCSTMANTNTHIHTHGSGKKTSHYRKQTRHGHEHMNTQNSSLSTFAQNIVETFHRKARARFETSFDAKLVQPPQLRTVGIWIRCIAKIKTLEPKNASHYRIDCRAPTERHAKSRQRVMELKKTLIKTERRVMRIFFRQRDSSSDKSMQTLSWLHAAHFRHNCGTSPGRKVLLMASKASRPGDGDLA